MHAVFFQLRQFVDSAVLAVGGVSDQFTGDGLLALSGVHVRGP